MLLQAATGELQVAGGTTLSSGDIWIIIPGGIDMTAQAAPPEHVVNQGKRRIFFTLWDLGQGLQCCFRTKVGSGQVDGIFKGKMEGAAAVFNLFTMAFSTGGGHMFRAGWLGNKISMGL